MAPGFMNLLAVLYRLEDAGATGVLPQVLALEADLEVDEVSTLMAEAHRQNLAWYFNRERTGVPTAEGWALTPAGSALVESESLTGE